MSQHDRIVRTRFGQVRGVPLTGGDEGITVFRGIPYAAPPTGPLRFRPPADPPAWSRVRACDTDPPIAMQDCHLAPSYEPQCSDFYWRGYPSCSEDCLYLNIATGSIPDGSQAPLRPVLIWFHDGLSGGYSYEPQFDPTVLARKGVVVVSVGHRLHLFGYLLLSQFANEQRSKGGNYGLMDQFKALDWVCDNIAGFGGDPGNITVGGQGGGAAKSAVLATSPKARGRVRRLINQSGLFWLRWFREPDIAERDTHRHLLSIGIDPDLSPDALRAIPAPVLLGPTDRMSAFHPSMVWDGEYIAYQEQTRNFAAFGGSLDVLAGSNLGEVPLPAGTSRTAAPFVDVRDYRAYMKRLLRGLYDKYDFPRIFPVTPTNMNHRIHLLDAYGLTSPDGLMTRRHFGAYRAASGAPGKTFVYLFSHRLPDQRDTDNQRDPDLQLSWRGSELWFTFGSLRPGVPPIRRWRHRDDRLADQLTSYWANFIRTGDPNGPGLPAWPVSDGQYGWMHLGEHPAGHVGLRDELEALTLEKLLSDPSVPRA